MDEVRASLAKDEAREHDHDHGTAQHS